MLFKKFGSSDIIKQIEDFNKNAKDINSLKKFIDDCRDDKTVIGYFQNEFLKKKNTKTGEYFVKVFLPNIDSVFNSWNLNLKTPNENSQNQLKTQIKLLHACCKKCSSNEYRGRFIRSSLFKGGTKLLTTFTDFSKCIENLINNEKIQNDSPKIDPKFQEKIIKKYYEKILKEDMTLYFDGKKRIWNKSNHEKRKNLIPLTDKEKIKASCEGARGSDKASLMSFLKQKLSHKVDDKEDDEKIVEEICKQSDLPKIVKYIEDNFILCGRKIGESMKDHVHGRDHAKRVVEYVSDVSELIKKNQTVLGLSVNKDDELIASFAALFHDSGRKNHFVDVFDETSAHKAEKELKKSGFLTDSNIKRVQNCIKNKDADIKGKDVACVMLHEVDCLDIQRVKSFDIKYMDLFQIFKHKNNLDDNSVRNSDFGKELVSLAEKCKVKIKQH